MNKKRILLVEDDPSLGFVTHDSLTHHGYEVSWCKDGAQAKDLFNKFPYDLCLVDIMLPKLDGFTLATFIRESNPQVPILFLTAKSMIEDRLEGFKRGGDDYICKPFHLEELLYRIEVFLSRDKKTPQSQETIISIGNFKFDTINLALIHPTGTQSLTTKEAAVLGMLCKHRNRILKREEILNIIWGSDDYFHGRSLDVFISRLRKYLKREPLIEIMNFHGIGFRLLEK